MNDLSTHSEAGTHWLFVVICLIFIAYLFSIDFIVHPRPQFCRRGNYPYCPFIFIGCNTIINWQEANEIIELRESICTQMPHLSSSNICILIINWAFTNLAIWWFYFYYMLTSLFNLNSVWNLAKCKSNKKATFEIMQ